ncbi:MAG: flagellar biosynthetic protein FliP [Proteobacteria bacterium]|nr:MAG: flagellar biosynthetic protein FliP [Pseudomonadota bacterium]
MLEPLTALAVVLAALFALRAALGRGRRRGGAPSLRVVASCALGAKQRLHVVEVEGERLLVGATDSAVSLLRRLPRAAREDAAACAGATGEASPAPAAPRARRASLAGWLAPLVLVALAALAASPAFAQGGAAPELDLAAALDGVGAATQPERISTTLEILFLLTLVSVAPSILLMATCFTRVVIVLALLRQALGVQGLPPNQVLVGLALAITLFVMAPLGTQLKAQALDPYVARQIDAGAATARTTDAVRGFLLDYTREKDLALFVSISKAEPPAQPADVPLLTLLPAYMISELRTAFEIGFSIFLPFLVIDIVIASMLISMQMIVLPPVLISLPFKLVLFVLVDGWNLIVSSLVRGLEKGMLP